MAGMTKDQLTKHIEAVIAPILASSVGASVADLVKQNLEAHLKAQAAAQPNYAAMLFGGTQKAAEDKPKGISFGAYVRALAAGKNDKTRAAHIAKAWGHPEVAKALEGAVEKAMSAGDPTGGGFLVPQEFSNDVIELLRATATVRSLGPTIMPMPNGSVKVPRITSGSSATYIGENSNITKSQLATGQLTLTWKKLAALVPISNDLIRYAGVSSDGIVRDDVVRALATREDYAFIRDNGLDGKPLGLRGWINPVNKFNAQATVNLANVTEDLGQAIREIMDADINLVIGQAGTGALTVNAGWIFSPRTWQYLFTLQTGLGTHAFKDEMKSGTLMGFPFRVTSQVPSTMSGGADTGGTQTEVYFGAFAHAVIGEAQGLMVDASDSAAYHDGTNVVAAFSQDQTVIRVIAEHDFALRHDKSFALIEQVTWGV